MKRIAATALAGAALAGCLIGATGEAQAAPVNVKPTLVTTACTYKVTGGPGSESYTAHVTNTCNSLKTRAIITYENFYGTYLKAYGPWVVSGSSKASTSSNITDTLVCWGHQYQYYADYSGTIKVGTGWGSSGCP